MRIGLFATVALGGVLLTGGTALADDVYSGIEGGLRTGYAIPFGPIAGSAGGATSPNVSDYISGDIPIWIDAGYRFASPNLFVGLYFQYGIGFNGSQLSANGANCQCSTNVVMYGLQAHYHFMPDQTIDPWVGYGIGMESANASGPSGSGGSYSGWDYGILQVGADYRGLMDNLSVGPLVMFGFGQYGNASTSPGGGGASTSASIPNTAMHEWLTIGIRGAYDFKIF
jgi:hypothetical protein